MNGLSGYVKFRFNDSSFGVSTENRGLELARRTIIGYGFLLKDGSNPGVARTRKWLEGLADATNGIPFNGNANGRLLGITIFPQQKLIRTSFNPGLIGRNYWSLAETNLKDYSIIVTPMLH